MKKLNVCVLFGGISPEYEVSLRSAECILSNLDPEKYNVIPVGITKQGKWIAYGGKDYSQLPGNGWLDHPDNRSAVLSPMRGQGLLIFEGDCVVRQHVDIVIPVLHGENGEDGSMQGLLQLSGIPYTGSDVTASATCMDKTMTKLVIDLTPVRQAKWVLVTRERYAVDAAAQMDAVEAAFTYPVFVKPAGTGSSVGVAKAKDRASLEAALVDALRYDRKVLVEEFIHGHEVEVAVLGNGEPVASVCGEIEAGAEFYDYEAKYISNTSRTLIPANITEEQAEAAREAAITVYKAMGCQGLSRVDFFVTYDGGEVVFNEINTLPGFTSISMYPKLFAASGIPTPELLDKLIAFGLEAHA